MTWIAAAPNGSLEGLLSLRPELSERYFAFRDLLFVEALVDPVVLELCRLRIASMLGDRQALDLPTPGVDVPADLVDALASWPTDPGFSNLARAALGLAEMFVIDAHGVTDSQITELQDLIGPAGVVALTTAIGLFDGESRLRRMLGET